MEIDVNKLSSTERKDLLDALIGTFTIEEQDAIVADYIPAWDQRIEETPKAYAAFRYYRDTPIQNRSIAKCVSSYYGLDKDDPDQYGEWKSKLTIWSRWSFTHHWQDRIRAWVHEQDRMLQAELVDSQKQMQDRHIKIALAMQGKASKRLGEMNEQVLSAHDVVRFLVEATKLERLSRGAPTEITAVGEIPASDMSSDYSEEELVKMGEALELFTSMTVVGDDAAHGGLIIDDMDSE